jgi:hypothetical protein
MAKNLQTAITRGSLQQAWAVMDQLVDATPASVEKDYAILIRDMVETVYSIIQDYESRNWSTYAKNEIPAPVVATIDTAISSIESLVAIMAGERAIGKTYPQERVLFFTNRVLNHLKIIGAQ